ncbi:hypothetical protein HY004_00400 [Candidatus Saccharibacteria bacterium]|nr:hypothetical protein [Candidatus Saccharibacteria bacterium]
MDSQPTVPTPSQQPAVSSGDGSQGSKSKALKWLGGLLSVLIVAGATYGILSMTVGQQPKRAESVASVTKVETPETIDSQIQSYMNSEQKLEDALSDAESQTVVDDVNSTQTLEGSYDSF